MTLSGIDRTALGRAAFGGVVVLCSGFAQAQDMAQPGPPTQQQSTQQQQQPAVNHSTANEMQDGATNSGVSGQMMRDKIFLRKAAQGGLAEVQLGQLASQKAGSQEVKDFGTKMVTDHTELNEDMKPIADSMGVMLPKKLSGKDQAEYDRLNGMSGTDFDTEYLTYMIKDHREDLHEFRAEAASTTDPTLRTAVDHGAKVIREHAHMVEELARTKGVPVPARVPRASPPPA